MKTSIEIDSPTRECGTLILTLVPETEIESGLCGQLRSFDHVNISKNGVEVVFNLCHCEK